MDMAEQVSVEEDMESLGIWQGMVKLGYVADYWLDF